MINVYIIIIILSLIIPSFVFIIRADRKIQKEPLSEDEKKHFFIKLIFDITNELKELEKENNVRFFLEKAPQEKESFDKLTSYSDYAENSLMAQNFGVAGAIFGSSSTIAMYLLMSIKNTRDIWKEYLLNKIIKDNTPQEEKKRISKEVENKINYLLNSRVLLVTNQSDIKKAWEYILKDKTLKNQSLCKTNIEVYRILINPNFLFSLRGNLSRRGLPRV